MRFDFDIPAVPPDDSKTNSEPEPETSRAFRSEERIEDLRSHFRIHSDTCVNDLDDHRFGGNPRRQ